MALKRAHTALLQSAALLLLLPTVLCACYDYSTDDEQLAALSSQYLNITISVSGTAPLPAATRTAPTVPSAFPAGTATGTATTRAPLGGENGNGRETDFDREKAITGITLILADGQLGNETAKIAFIKYFPVTATTGTYDTNPHGHIDTNIEQKYTTGNQLVSRTELDMTEDKTYYVYVVANRWIAASKGDGLSTIKDMTLHANQLFTGDGYNPDNCRNFVMASEQDVTVNFGASTGVSATTQPNAVYFSVTQPIIIERLAARIDFCTAYSTNKNATYSTYTVNVGGTATNVTGFKYDTTPDGSGYFILESITPFNIYNEQQYLFERVTGGWTGTPATTYLGQETAENYIVDPYTVQKDSKSLSYQIPLSASMPATWQRTAASLNSQSAVSVPVGFPDGTKNFVIAYCMENTLMPTSPLKQYATGLAITGSYYDTSDNFLTRKTFYGYLRHQGEPTGTTPYKATELTAANLTADDRTGTTGTAMNFSIVRNNIYRVNIESVQPAGGWITLRVAEHYWRMVTHPAITM